MKKIKSKMAHARKIGNYLFTYKSSRSSLISSLNAYRFQSVDTIKSDFGQHLSIKRLFKAVYGNYLNNSQVSKKKMTIWNLLLENESRLDVILFRSQLFENLGSSYQAVKNKNVYVNGKLCLNPYKKLESGNVVSLCPKFFVKYMEKEKEYVKKNTLSVCSHLQIDYKTGSIIMVKQAEEGEFPFLLG